jgi:hypothetical protein
LNDNTRNTMMMLVFMVKMRVMMLLMHESRKGINTIIFLRWLIMAMVLVMATVVVGMANAGVVPVGCRFAAFAP